MKPEEVVRLCQDKGIEIIDLKFTDVPGTLQHVSLPKGELSEKNLEAGYGFDGSSIRGFKAIEESDMLLIPDPTTANVDPFCKIPTLTMFCNVLDPITRDYFNRDPRWVAQKAEVYLKESGMADVSYWGPEIEHFVFDSARFDQNERSGYYFVDSDEGVWNSGQPTSLDGGPNLAYRPRYKEGYFPAPPFDTFQDFRSEVTLKLIEFGIDVGKHHHEVATAGQAEIDMRYDSLTRMADSVVIQKYVVKNVARAHGKVATFMPKPVFGDNGSGMHVHQSLWKNGTNLFYDAEGAYAQISETCKYYIGGLMAHAPALLAFIAPTTNSYKRLVPGFEAPVSLVYSMRNRSACTRIPVYFPNPEAKRIEFRLPDPTCNPYLGFAATLMAGIDGIVNKTDPGDPMDVDLYSLSPEEAAKVKQVPGSLEAVLDALEEDHEFLLRGNVFTEDLIDTWLDYKRTREVDPMRLRPHPYEFFMYFDA